MELKEESMILMCRNVPVYHIAGQRVLSEALLPGMMQKNPCTASFRTWMKYRYASGTNTLARQLRGITFGQGARERINRETHALSFSDCYWVRGESERLLFEEISPYYAPFWDGAEAFAGQAAPTLYVSGALSKEWRRDGRLYKYGDVGIELECIALCEACGIAVERAVAVSRKDCAGGIAVTNITSPEQMLEQADMSGRLDPEEFCETDILELFGLAGAQMLIVDAVIGNGDRHAGNFGWLRDSGTGAYLGMAPLYDFDHALDSTSASDRLLVDAVRCCAKEYGAEAVRIAETARQSGNEVFRRRAQTILEMIRCL